MSSMIEFNCIATGIGHLRVEQIVVALSAHLLVFDSDKLFSCDFRVNENVQRRLADGVQLGLVPVFVLVHVRMPYRELQPGLFLGLGTP